MKHLQHTSETFETLETYTWNMCFQHNISLLLGRMEARQCARGSGLAALVGGGPAAVAARRGEDVLARLGEGARSAEEPLVPALPRWSARDQGYRRCCAAMSRAAQASA